MPTKSYLEKSDIVQQLNSAFDEEADGIENFEQVTSAPVYSGKPEWVDEAVLTGTERGFWPHQIATAIDGLNDALSFGAKGMVLGDSVGAGKTDQALMMLERFMRAGVVTGATILVPLTVFNDWKVSIARYKAFAGRKVITARTVNELVTALASLTEKEKQTSLILLKQNSRASLHTKELNEFFSSPKRLLIADESPGMSEHNGIRPYVMSSKSPFKLFLSGTVVSTSLNDKTFLRLMANNYGTSYERFYSFMSDLQYLLNRIPPSCKLNSGPVANAFFNFINFAALMRKTIYLRMQSQLNLKIPASDSTSHTLLETEGDGVPRIKARPSFLFGSGTSVAISCDARKNFNNRSETIEADRYAKLQSLLASKGATLLICANSKRRQNLIDRLKAEKRVALNPQNKTAFKKAEKAQTEGSPIFFVTTFNAVEGFNIQNFGLRTIIFVDATPNADVVDQAVGRGVRPVIAENPLPVSVHMIMRNTEEEVLVEKGLAVTLRAKTMLWAMLASPGTAWEWLIRRTILLKTGEESIASGFTKIYDAVNARFNELISELSSITSWSQALLPGSPLFKHPFLFSKDFSAFKVDGYGLKFDALRAQKEKITAVLKDSLAFLSMATLLSSRAFLLVQRFGFLDDFVTLLQARFAEVVNERQQDLMKILLSPAVRFFKGREAMALYVDLVLRLPVVTLTSEKGRLLVESYQSKADYLPLLLSKITPENILTCVGELQSLNERGLLKLTPEQKGRLQAMLSVINGSTADFSLFSKERWALSELLDCESQYIDIFLRRAQANLPVPINSLSSIKRYFYGRVSRGESCDGNQVRQIISFNLQFMAAVKRGGQAVFLLSYDRLVFLMKRFTVYLSEEGYSTFSYQGGLDAMLNNLQLLEHVQEGTSKTRMVWQWLNQLVAYLRAVKPATNSDRYSLVVNILFLPEVCQRLVFRVCPNLQAIEATYRDHKPDVMQRKINEATKNLVEAVATGFLYAKQLADLMAVPQATRAPKNLSKLKEVVGKVSTFYYSNGVVFFKGWPVLMKLTLGERATQLVKQVIGGVNIVKDYLPVEPAKRKERSQSALNDRPQSPAKKRQRTTVASSASDIDGFDISLFGPGTLEELDLGDLDWLEQLSVNSFH